MKQLSLTNAPQFKLYSLLYAFGEWTLACPSQVWGWQNVIYCKNGILIVANDEVPEQVAREAIAAVVDA